METWGGRREGAGRKPKTGFVAHRTRPEVASRFPIHVTLKVRPGIPSLRSSTVFPRLHEVFVGACERDGFRIAHFSVQSNHVHLVVEAGDDVAFATAMRSLTIRLARAINEACRRQGAVFGQRYHMRILRTPLEVRRALAYVLDNLAHHAGRPLKVDGALCVDHCSSAVYTKVYAHPVSKPQPRAGPPPVAEPLTWLLREGWWKTHGYLVAGEVATVAGRSSSRLRAPRGDRSREPEVEARRPESRERVRS